jgi:hypothetical protein
MVSPEVAHHFAYSEEDDGDPCHFVDLDADDANTKKPALL